MRWQYIKIALLGGLLGFAGQCLGDYFFWSMDGPVCSVVLREDRLLAVYPGSCTAQREQQVNQLIWQAIFLMWLRDRAELAGRSGAIAAFLGVSSLVAADHL